jgi:hypothetical protein
MGNIKVEIQRVEIGQLKIRSREAFYSTPIFPKKDLAKALRP